MKKEFCVILMGSWVASPTVEGWRSTASKRRGAKEEPDDEEEEGGDVEGGGEGRTRIEDMKEEGVLC